MNQADEIDTRVRTLNQAIWEQRVGPAVVADWLAGFSKMGADSHELELLKHLLCEFAYFGDREVRIHCRALFRDCFLRAAVLPQARSNGGGPVQTRQAVETILGNTAFLGLGDAASSGQRLAYTYRQTNEIPERNFYTADSLIALGEQRQFEHIVFIDDTCGTGRQATRYFNRKLKALRQTHSGSQFHCCFIVATASGLAKLRNQTSFDRVDSLYSLDNTFRTLGEHSRYARALNLADRQALFALATAAGSQLRNGHAEGFGSLGLMVGYIHNTPNNTLPIFWATGTAETTWRPPFPRYLKAR